MFSKEELDNIRKKEEEWLKICEGWKERKEMFKTYSGFPIKRLYTPLDVKDINYLEDVGFPGMPPYTRGIYPTMYRGRFWTIREVCGYGTPEDTNQRLKYLIEHGETGLNIVFDYPTHNGYDSDNPDFEDEVGYGGVPVDTLLDMETILDGIPIERMSTSLINSPFVAQSIFSMYLAVAEKRGLDFRNLYGTNQNDFLMWAVFCSSSNVIPPRPLHKLTVDVVEYCTNHVPKWHPISFAGYNYRETGINAVQELGLVFANAIACIEEMLERGYKVDQFAPRLSFFLSAHNDFFEEIAKYRAARRIWYKIMKERFKAENPASYTFRFHVQTAGSTLTAQQPLNNIVRTAYQALAAVLGGAQSLHTNSYDEAICLPTAQAVLVALRTQHILQEETNVTSTVDPLGGSYYIEYLTKEIEKRVFEYLETIDAMGGLISAVEKGWVHSEVSKAMIERQKAVEKGELKIVGVNCYQTEEEIPVEVFRPNPMAAEAQKEKLRKIKMERNNEKVKETLDELRKACEKNENVVYPTFKAVKAYATIQEISTVFREVYGIWTRPLIF